MSIDAYLQEIALYTNMDKEEKKPATPKVRLMTIHQAKGLEFPYVFVSGLSEGIFPSMKTLRERKGDGEEEERRLMYVAVTRAEKELFLTESEGFNAASKLSKYPSRFLREIQRSLFVTEGDMDELLWQESDRMVQFLGLDFSSNPDAPIPPATVTQTFWEKGTRVRHEVLGEGTIVEYNEARGSYSVAFGNGTRNIRASFLKLVEE